MGERYVQMNYSNAESPARTLALAVIYKALFDFRGIKKTARRTAREFFRTDNQMFIFWCDAAEVSPREVIRAVGARVAV